MYLHLGRGNIVRTEDILAITDFERLTSFKRGQDYIEEFLKREDIDNPKGQIFPQSCVFVLKGIDEEEEKEEKIKSLKDLSKEELSKMSIIEKSLFDLQMRKNEEKRKRIIKEVDELNNEKFGNYDKFSEGGEFYLSEKELKEEERKKGKGNYEKIVGRISLEEEEEVDKYIDETFPEMSYCYKYTRYYLNDMADKAYFSEEYFCGATIDEIKNILPKHNLYEKCRMVAAFRIHNNKEYGEEITKEIEKREGIGYVLGFGKLYLYGKKVYYPEKTRLYIYVSEYTPLTLYKRIKEEENFDML